MGGTWGNPRRGASENSGASDVNRGLQPLRMAVSPTGSGSLTSGGAEMIDMDVWYVTNYLPRYIGVATAEPNKAGEVHCMHPSPCHYYI